MQLVVKQDDITASRATHQSRSWESFLWGFPLREAAGWPECSALNSGITAGLSRALWDTNNHFQHDIAAQRSKTCRVNLLRKRIYRLLRLWVRRSGKARVIQKYNHENTGIPLELIESTDKRHTENARNKQLRRDNTGGDSNTLSTENVCKGANRDTADAQKWHAFNTLKRKYWSYLMRSDR